MIDDGEAGEARVRRRMAMSFIGRRVEAVGGKRRAASGGMGRRAAMRFGRGEVGFRGGVRLSVRMRARIDWVAEVKWVVIEGW